MPATEQPGHSLAELVNVMRRLLGPGGCPWDREQTLTTLRPFLLEETYEVLDALESEDVAAHREELGDLLMQIVFQAELRAAEGAFGIDDVVRAIADKLIRRHPHVFGEQQKLETADQVLDQWAALKDQEKPRGTLEGVPRSLPALARAQLITDRAARVGFDWPEVAGARAKIDEELAELDRAMAAGDRERIDDELGDVLFAAVNLARKSGSDAEASLRRTIDRFASRFAHIERRLAEGGRGPRDASLEEMDALWEEAKREARGVTEK